MMTIYNTKLGNACAVRPIRHMKRAQHNQRQIPPAIWVQRAFNHTLKSAWQGKLFYRWKSHSF
jgi:hypothetical protein